MKTVNPEDMTFSFEDWERTIGFLEGGRDPDLWHQLVDGMNYDDPRALDYVLWIVRQPDCDIATAALTFVSLRCADHVCAAPRLHSGADDRVSRIASEICARSEASGYTRAKIGWHAPDHIPTPAAVLADIRANCAKLGLAAGRTHLPIPAAVLGADFDKPPAAASYFVDEGGFTHMSAMDPFMQAIMGFRSN
ncbi:DUF4274 domain-containing protein [Defluviimonas sp. SAOS-178_SWC]|uniref:DUF4274 domain-containing protein n=1 Tax=Defluviimonas sp. SAOS-178_SWC TaxID=3121287 RepID=UPI003221DBF0